MTTSTSALVLVLTTSVGDVIQYLVAEFSSLETCEAEGRTQAANQSSLHPYSQAQWYCMEKL
jgi:hypothetical protein